MSFKYLVALLMISLISLKSHAETARFLATRVSLKHIEDTRESVVSSVYITETTGFVLYIDGKKVCERGAKMLKEFEAIIKDARFLCSSGKQTYVDIDRSTCTVSKPTAPKAKAVAKKVLDETILLKKRIRELEADLAECNSSKNPAINNSSDMKKIEQRLDSLIRDNKKRDSSAREQ
jgi:hypothetical protein